MRSYIIAAALALVSGFVSAAPVAQDLHFNCDVSDLVPQLPAGQTSLSVPSNAKPRFVTVGVGVQNYTCSSAGTYTSTGAVASLYDVSCLAHTPVLPNLQNLFFKVQDPAAAQSVIDVLLLDAVLKIGDHYFSPNGSAIVPVFDFTNTLQDKTQFTAAKKTGNIASPDSIGDVDWLQLANVEGSVASTTFRLNTHEGQPPASCKPGSPDISVPYAAQYWFYK